MNIWLVGGEKVIPTSVEKAIKGDGYTVNRISGEDRYETAAMVAEAGISLSGKKPSKVFVASGTSFADALAVSPVAFAKGYPIILTEKDSTSDFSKKELGNIGTDAKILVGGEAVVSKAVAANLSIKEDARVAGADRAVTANLVSDWAKKSEGFNPANAALVGGTNGNGADSLVAASLGGKSLTTLHFAGWDATATYFKDHSNELTGKGFVFGGKAAVSEGQVSAAQTAAQSAISNQSISVTPSGSTSVTSGTVVSSTDAKPTFVTYTAVVPSGVDNVTIQLARAEDVNSSSSKVTFKKVDGLPRADFSTVDTVGDLKIQKVNGVALAAPALSVASAPVVNGKVTFTVSTNADNKAGVAVPVVYAGASGTTFLQVDANGAPSSKFGVGGAVTSVPGEAAAITADTNVTVKTVSDTTFSGTYSTSTGMFNMRSGDTYKINGTATTRANFLSVLSVGDTVKVNPYQLQGTAPFVANVFDITSDKVAAPTDVKVALVDTNVDGVVDTTRITFTAPKDGLTATSGAQVKRATVTDGVTGTYGAATTANITYTGSTGQVDIAGVSASGDYAYQVHILGQTGSTYSEYSSAAMLSVPVTVTPSVAGAPQSTVAAFQDNNNNGNIEPFSRSSAALSSGVDITAGQQRR